MTTASQLIRNLNRALNQRRVADGTAILDRTEETWATLLPARPNATELLLLLAQWVDVGYRDYHLLDSHLAKFSPQIRRKLQLDDYLRLRVVEGFRSLYAEDLGAALDSFDFVLKGACSSKKR